VGQKLGVTLHGLWAKVHQIWHCCGRVILQMQRLFFQLSKFRSIRTFAFMTSKWQMSGRGRKRCSISDVYGVVNLRGEATRILG